MFPDYEPPEELQQALSQAAIVAADIDPQTRKVSVAVHSDCYIPTRYLEQAEKEIGDVLFAAVNVGRKAGCDCEKALKESVERFAARFTLAEQKALADGKTVTELSDVEWDEYYRLAKKELVCK